MSYCSVADVKNYLGISKPDDDALLADLIAEAQKAIDNYTGRTFEASSDTTRYFDVDVDVDGAILYFDGDLCAVTTCTTNADASGGGTSLTKDTHYIAQPRNITPWYGFKMLSSSDYDWDYTDDAEMGIEIVGRWAYSSSAPDDIKHACKRLAAYYYRQKDAQVFDTTAMPEAGILVIPQGIPADVKIILDRYERLN
jgi:uncharacterized phiE125 gp8 family phage protein